MLHNASDKNSQAQESKIRNGESADNHINDVAVVKASDEQPRFIAPTHGGVDILKLLSELEDMIEKAPRLLNYRRLDDEKFHMTLLKIRANLPEEMKRAVKLARDSERIVVEARDNAERVVSDARSAALTEVEKSKADAARMREEVKTELIQRREATQKELNQMRQVAEQEARRLRDEAETECERLLIAAREQAELLAGEHEVLRLAEARSQELQAQAAQEAASVRRGADEYAHDVLIQLETVLGKAVTQVQHGRTWLEGK